jgi:phosphate-transporting ATPase
MLLVNQLQLLNNKIVNFSLDKNEFKIIHGPNSSGKSLLLKALAQLVPGKYEEFLFNDKEVSTYDPDWYRSRVLYVPSAVYQLDQSVEEFLDFPLKLKVYADLKEMNKAIELAKEFKLVGQPLSRLSSGQRQLLSLTRSIHLKAQVLLLDEPTSHLDPAMTLVAEKLMQDWLREGPRSIVLVSHDHSLAGRLHYNAHVFESFTG